MKKLIFVIFVILSSLLIIDATYIEPTSVKISNIHLKIPGFSSEVETKIAVISDLHIGIGYTDINRLKQIVEKINEQNADLIVNLGDYDSFSIIRSKMNTTEISNQLKKLKAPYGVYSILGNHDGLIVQHKWLDGTIPLSIQRQLICNILKNAQIKLLDNNYEVITTPQRKFVLIGLTDSYSTTLEYYNNYLKNTLKPAKYPNLPLVLKGIPDKLPVILLNHSPDIFPQVTSTVNLTLSGHTHGAQINLPIINSLLTPSIYSQRYRYGLIQSGNKFLYVTSGIGGFPIRINNLPEITILHIKG